MSNPSLVTGSYLPQAAAAAADRAVVVEQNTIATRMHWSVDGESWTLVESNTENTSGSEPGTGDVATDGTDFVLTKNSTGGIVRSYLFTWSTKTLGAVVDVITASPIGSGFPPKIARRSSDYVISHMDHGEKIMGTDYSRLAVSYGTTSGWTKVSSGIFVGSSFDTLGMSIVAATDSRCHVTYTDGLTPKTRQFVTGNTWAGSDDTNASTLTRSTNGRWAAINVGGSEYIVNTMFTALTTVKQAQSQASTTWNTQTTASSSRSQAACKIGTVLRTFGVNTSNGEIQYRESTDGGVTWSGSDLTFATPTDLGLTPVDTNQTLAFSWTVAGVLRQSVIFKQNASPFDWWHYYRNAVSDSWAPRPIFHNMIRRRGRLA